MTQIPPPSLEMAATTQPPEACADLARAPRILNRFAEVLASRGVVGEERAAKLLYLIVTTRFLDRPASAVVKGPSSGGKSYIVERVLHFFPEAAYYALTAMSEHALAYDDEPLRHRFLVIYEAAGLGGDTASYLVRSLLSEGWIRYKTVENTKEAGLKPKLIEREGPTGLLLTTTAIKLHPENETRLLSIPVKDTPEQTRAVMLAIAKKTPQLPVENGWIALQFWLEKAEHRVTIPFAEALAEAIPPDNVRLRRDFEVVLNLIRAHAILHQASRERDTHGQIIATLDDYAVVRELVADLLAEGIEASIPPAVRQTVEAVSRLMREERGKYSVQVMEVARELRVEKSLAWRRVQHAIKLGFLVNQEEHKGMPARLVLGEPLPDDQEVLPSADDLRLRDLSLDVVIPEDSNIQVAEKMTDSEGVGSGSGS